MQNIKKLKGLVFLSIGIALLGYSLIALSSLMGSSRAVLMMGSAMQPGGSVVSDRIIATIFLLLIFIVGLGLVGMSVKNLMDFRRK